jgi:hypothetical protein
MMGVNGDDIGRACSTRKGEDDSMQFFGGKLEVNRQIEKPEVGGKIKLNWILEKRGRAVWTRFIWLRIRTSGGLL